MEYIQNTFDYLSQLSPILAGVLIAATVFLLIGLRLVFKKPPSHLTAFTGEAGSVLVSRKALQELIKQACLLDEWVDAARPNVRVKNGKVSSTVEIRISAPDNLKDVCERVQDRITRLLQKSLSFDQIGDIQIVVKSFAPNHESDAIPASTPVLQERSESSLTRSDPPSQKSPKAEDKGPH